MSDKLNPNSSLRFSKNPCIDILYSLHGQIVPKREYSAYFMNSFRSQMKHSSVYCAYVRYTEVKLINIPQKPVLVPMSVRLSPEIAEKVHALAQSLSMEHMRVTEGAILRQIITDFFSSESVQNVNGEAK